MANWWYCVAALVAVAVFVNALDAASTDEDPTGNAGLSAALLGLCTAGMLFGESLHSRRGSNRRLPKVLMGVVAIAGAYLWIAGEADIHPADPVLLRLVSFTWIAASFVTILVPLIGIAIGSKSDDRSDEGGDKQ